ncbi:MAG TPA: heavy metal-binding domain-containing protein [Firmicutes bacterium]|nr:heavy metal-binding domain-containing protein [Candidatus Fermentithermobacillaceae bacterium]
MPTCPNCGGFVKREERQCPHCGHRADFEQIAREERQRREERFGVVSQSGSREDKKAVLERLASSVITVTIPYVPGREIAKVVGIVTAEVVLGTGFFTELTTGLADFLGIRGTEFELKWREAKDAALQELRMNAAEMGCNAVVGLDMELETVRDIPMIIATGTGVVLADEVGRA